MRFGRFLRRVNNRYVYATLIFLVVIFFVDQFNVFEQIRLQRTLNDMRKQSDFYQEEIKKNRLYLEALQTDTALLERVAREDYKMKRDDEVIYLIETQK